MHHFLYSSLSFYIVLLLKGCHVLWKRATRPLSEVFAAGAETNISSRRMASVSSLKHSTTKPNIYKTCQACIPQSPGVEKV